jgi:glycosyltransferase involved in cell wall biosynthesis
MSAPASGKLVLSTALLSWNRAELLERTLGSYAETTTVPYEITIIDNGSTDKSPSIIEDFCKANLRAKAIFLRENIGGEALNQALQGATGMLLDISENDLEYFPGWAERALAAFGAFDRLGQLSLFAPVPTDDEVWEVKPCVLRHANGEIIYETNLNVGASSILRKEVWDKGVRLHTKRSGTFLFPDDGQLSADIRKAGFVVAWADRYLVRNIGHSFDEFEQRVEYYTQNYASKPWVGIGGWQQHIARWKAKPRPRRSTFLPIDAPILPEKSGASDQCREPLLWSMVDGWTAEVETMEFLYSLVRLTKPRFVVETGTWRGYTAVAIGDALRANGMGQLVSLEVDATSASVARRHLAAADLVRQVEVLNQASLTYEPNELIDLLLLDSELQLRENELRQFRRKLRPGATVVFHDTSQQHGVVRAAVERLEAEGVLKGIHFQTPRGISVCQYQCEKPLPGQAI